MVKNLEVGKLKGSPRGKWLSQALDSSSWWQHGMTFGFECRGGYMIRSREGTAFCTHSGWRRQNLVASQACDEDPMTGSMVRLTWAGPWSLACRQGQLSKNTTSKGARTSKNLHQRPRHRHRLGGDREPGSRNIQTDISIQCGRAARP